MTAHRYAELHAHSAYSFLDGANEPEALAAAAVELGLEALALTDFNGMPEALIDSSSQATVPPHVW